MLLLLVSASYSRIHPIIPVHYGINGQADSWGEKSILWYFAVGNVFINIFLGVLSRYPNVYNYPFKITEKNRDRVYSEASLFVTLLRLAVSVCLTIITILMMLSVEKIPVLLLICVILLPVISAVFGLVLLLKNGR